MYRKCTAVVPLLKSCHVPASVHVRNIWDITPIPNVRSVLRGMERQMENFERAVFGNDPLRLLTPRFIKIEGTGIKQDSSYCINIDVEDFKPEDIKISLKDRILKIEANMDKIAQDGSRLQQSIVREFTLPPNVEPSSVKSLFHNSGILSIQAEVNNPKKPTDIPVQHLDSDDTPKSKM